MFNYFKKIIGLKPTLNDDSELFELVCKHIKSSFYESNLDVDIKATAVNRLTDAINTCLQSDNIAIKIREYIFESVIEYSKFQVLCLKKDEVQYNEFFKSNYISAELHYKICKLYKYNDQLKNLFINDNDISDETIISLCNSKCRLLVFFINGMNILRLKKTNDFIRNSDWLNSFTKAQLIYEEGMYRSNAGMPSLFDNELEFIAYSHFGSIILDGYDNPYSEFQKRADGIYQLDL